MGGNFAPEYASETLKLENVPKILLPKPPVAVFPDSVKISFEYHMLLGFSRVLLQGSGWTGDCPGNVVLVPEDLTCLHLLI